MTRPAEPTRGPTVEPTRRVLVGVVTALALVLPAIVAADHVQPPDLPADAVAPTRVAGPDRVLTAIALARHTFERADTAVLARADAFPDAVTGAYLAGQHDAPILLTRPDRMHPTIEDTLRDLGVEEVIILGGGEAVSGAIETRLRRRHTVTRIQGRDRFATAAAAARSGTDIGVAPPLEGDGRHLRTAVLGTGQTFPDVLAAGPLAYAGAHPVLLATQTRLPEPTEAAIVDRDIEQVVIVGGTEAVGEGVATRLRDMGVAVTRVAGSTRTGTATAVSTLTRRLLGWGAQAVTIARGDDFADALAVAPLAARSAGTVLLTPSPGTLGADAFLHLQASCDLTGTLVVAGGEAAVGAGAANEASLATVCADAAAPMTGARELHDADPEASGSVHLWFASRCYAVAVDGIDPPSAAHIHHAVVDADGPVAATLRTPDAGGFAAGCLDDTDVNGEIVSAGTADALVSAVQSEPFAYYVNVHTDAEPAGAVRGNLGAIEIAGPTALSGDRVIDPATGTFTADAAAGTGTVEVRRVRPDRLCAFTRIAGLESPVIAAHVHRGRIDENGPVVVPLDVGAARTSFSHLGCSTADPALLDEIVAEPGAFYVNVHTAERPAGALRGQLGADAVVLALGASEVDDDDPEAPRFDQGPADAVGIAQIYAGSRGGDTRAACLELVMIPPEGDRIAAPDGAEGGVHVHRGRVDQNGEILFGWTRFDGEPAASGTPIVIGFACTDAPAAAVEATLTDPAAVYLNVHTEAFPGGAVRGQLGPELSTVATGAQIPDGGDLTAAALTSVWTGSEANPDVVCGQTLANGLDSDLADITLRRGGEGDRGPAIVSLAGDGDAAGILDAAAFSCVTDADPDDLAGLRADPDAHFVRIDTDLHPAGALRGQLGAGRLGSTPPPGVRSSLDAPGAATSVRSR